MFLCERLDDAEIEGASSCSSRVDSPERTPSGAPHSIFAPDARMSASHLGRSVRTLATNLERTSRLGVVSRTWRHRGVHDAPNRAGRTRRYISFRQAMNVFSGSNPSDRYRSVAPVGLFESTPSDADV